MDWKQTLIVYLLSGGAYCIIRELVEPWMRRRATRELYTSGANIYEAPKNFVLCVKPLTGLIPSAGKAKAVWHARALLLWPLFALLDLTNSVTISAQPKGLDASTAEVLKKMVKECNVTQLDDTAEGHRQFEVTFKRKD